MEHAATSAQTGAVLEATAQIFPVILTIVGLAAMCAEPAAVATTVHAPQFPRLVAFHRILLEIATLPEIRITFLPALIAKTYQTWTYG